ncbi:ATP-dependent RNA helicase RhlB [Allochromatium warmingii]|uniref:ATP-dependent RNA helicase RhlB n=1 Tax=Allochromatium warmingii TaxID=61595 RepID=A0A1H3DWL4_ALLWA|nr:DEAD/DEAH box helicase [Allochromatium warmingii]SDX70781.1 ATP-dependent RNA helicase RhlB [Allochromatium warmingii]
MTDTHLTSTRFDSLALDPRILAGLAEAGFTQCTPIQAETLPVALTGQDIAGQAQTGTGKTAAFLVALMQHLLNRTPAPHPDGRSRPRALVLAPTRELAVQIHQDTLLLAKHTGLRSTVVFGGTGYQEQREALAQGVEIVIGTPGRLIDYYKQQVFDLQGIEVVVLDEADRMFDLGFIKDIRYLFRQMPPVEQRLGMLFSATLSYRVTELAYEHMNQPRLVKIETEQVTADRVRQICYMTANEEKIPLLLGLIRGWPEGRIIVFVNTKREADRVWGYLQGNGIDTAVLSGDVPQPKRLKLLRDFTNGSLPVLVGTDVAARGLHIPDVTHVVNYDLPEDPEDYVHRIGRTARAGAAGDAVSFVCETYAFCLLDIEQYIEAKVPVAPVDPALLAEVDPRSRLRPERADREERRDSRGRLGERSSSRRVGREPRPERERPERPARSLVPPPPAAPERLDPPIRDLSEAAPSVVNTLQLRFKPLDERFFEQLVDEWPVRVGAEIEIPDMPQVRRIRRMRGQLEPAALTSPPIAPRAVTAASAPTERSASERDNRSAVTDTAVTEARANKRRRRRKPNRDAHPHSVSGEPVVDQAPEAVD